MANDGAVDVSPAKLRELSIPAVLGDGTKVTIRAIHPEDKNRLQIGFHRLSPTSVKYRFLGLKKELSVEELIYLTEIDYDVHVALVVTVHKNGEELIVGVGRFIEVEPGERGPTAEIGLAVVDEFHRRGIGGLLFEIMKELAGAKGIARFEAWVLSDNCRMCDIFRHHATDYTCTRDEDVYHIVCSIP